MNIEFIGMLPESKTIREQKGKSLLNIEKDYTIIDIETTGLDPEYDSIIEIGALKVRNNTIVDTFNTLIHTDDYIPEFITELTGITNKMLKGAPKIDIVLTTFLDFIGSDILVGHNVNFDINFLYDACLKELNKYLTNNFIDTMRLSRRLNKELKHHRLYDLKCFYNIDVDKEHRALEDCTITYNIFLKIQEDIIRKYVSFDNFILEIKKRKNNLKAKDIIATNDNINEDSPFFEKEVVFTGVLEKMIRKDAMQIVANMGGYNRDNVTNDTNFLVLGNNDYCKAIKDGKSLKHKKAEAYKLKGNDIEIISESVFYDIINDYNN